MSTISLVTGGNRGIGREICRQLAKRGHVALLTARSASAATAAAREIGAEPLQLDVIDASGVARAVRSVGERFGKLDVLINNAAITYDTWQRAVTADLAVVRETAETNLYGPWLVVREFLPLLRVSDHPRIVNVSSEAASLTSMGGGTPAYTASKTALNADPDARRRAGRGQDPGQRGLPRLGRHRYGRTRRAAGRRWRS